MKGRAIIGWVVLGLAVFGAYVLYQRKMSKGGGDAAGGSVST